MEMNTINLPQREGWTTSDMMRCGDDFTVDDAAKIMMQFWHEWADNFEARLFQLVDQTEYTEICAPDDMYLIHKFSKYPERPTVQPGISPEKQGALLDRVWQSWAAEVEKLFVALKECLLRGKPLPKDDLAFYYTIDNEVSRSPIPSLNESLNDDFSLTPVSTLLRILLWMSGVKFSVSSSPPTDLMGRMERLCIETGTYSGSGCFPEEMATRIGNLTL
ncbi:hypothetical protein N7G274_002838 [Stereocaulon virgatum]|uniref:Uncharacterized protein n=1 Tax=Stereocaulon virgatum TaxID=373712 RepID=A0ABR4AIZ0_9LECA